MPYVIDAIKPRCSNESKGFDGEDLLMKQI